MAHLHNFLEIPLREDVDLLVLIDALHEHVIFRLLSFAHLNHTAFCLQILQSPPNQYTHTPHLPSQLGLTQAFLEPDRIIAFDKSDAERTRDEVLRPALHARYDILALDDRLDVLRDRCVRSNTILVHQADKVRLGQQGRRGRSTLTQLADGRHEHFAHGEGRQGLGRPFVVRIHFEVVPREDNQTCRCTCQLLLLPQ